MRYTASMILGVFAASLLFWVMTQLILVETDFVPPSRTTPVVLHEVQVDTEVKPKVDPITPPEAVKPPPIERIELAYQGKAPVLSVTPVTLDTSTLSDGFPIGAIPVPSAGDIQGSPEPLTDLDIETKAPLNYPASALRKGIEGIVVIENTIDANGKVTHVKIVNSSHRSLERSVLVSAMKWQYAKSDFAERVHKTKVEFQLTD